jgi:ribonuclease D
VGVGSHCFLFDLGRLTGGFPRSLKQVLEDPKIVKVFHDFCEDTSALVRQYHVHCDKVFDTQIAHRLLNPHSSDPKDQNINLNSLLKIYLQVENNQKDKMNELMREDPELWWRVSPSF